MREFKSVVIDDERLAREELKSILSEYPEITVVGEAQNGEEGIELIRKTDPDLIFLDVNMPELSGFEMLKKLDNIPHVIFITAYDEYALKAFEVNALDYILKPIDPERLAEAIEKLKEREESEFESAAEIRTSRKDRMLTSTDRVFIKDGEKCFFVELSKVRMLESDGNYVKVYFGKNRPLILRSLNSFESRLDPEHFFRANRKFIINLDWVESVENWFNGGLRVELKHEIEGKKETVDISRRQAIRFRELLSL
ncbi:LytTR family DNA-binding domain-containing protein [Crocinitomicaceae bacterium]|nr:LytTR family DNA-binding domain-containing protein [Crocinitomicaceae bacterium]MDB3906691.1 LytTR family DNA-binding domain-containing protein [Crocinitomicaceae bacterium]MDC0257628.1 LytTR family DNA-binding domain-containing protein [Crocinitomicaceae bacterium]